ncbi:MAG TPA: hypothetical protein VJ937_02180 [Salinivirga sp.]|uniref:hypothetical protein n=1 Tax=Salinivirga sp. TaxID=1970192 RepID=UPI002B49432B|nr:hypothetical protein [Salinivirga sp.]HKK58263.1 hypothetical protein [Salinivirga sp.]
MKKTALILSLAFSLVLLFAACEQKQIKTQGEEELQLTSPKGFKAANSISELKSFIDLNTNDRIISIEYLESEKANAALISFVREDNQKKQTIAIGKGKMHFESTNLIYKKLSPKNQKAQNGGSWIISCTGTGDCNNCTVQGTVDADGNLNFSCSDSCCDMEVKTNNEATYNIGD